MNEIIDEPIRLPTHRGKSYRELGGITPTCLLLGAAGSGKSFTLNRHKEEDEKFCFLTATTGVAAINLNCITINSALGFFNASSISNDLYLQRALRKIKLEGYVWLVIDEFSMMHYKVLDTIFNALESINKQQPTITPLGLLLTGDPLQLPPVAEALMINGKAVFDQTTHRQQKSDIPWPFKADCWYLFEANKIVLNKIYRQSDPNFLRALAQIRVGNGQGGASLLKLAGVKFEPKPDENFPGTVIVGTNKEAQAINETRLKELETEKISVESTRWFVRKYEPQEWKYVPEVLELKIGAKVMILANQPQLFNYVNGDVGVVVGTKPAPIFEMRTEYDPVLGEEVEKPVFVGYDNSIIAGIDVKLNRNEMVVTIPRITRTIWQYEEPDSWEVVQNHNRMIKGRVQGVRANVWILGELDYFPLTLGYASTVHKTQGLTLNQIEFRLGWFVGQPHMIYVGLSRCRTPEGIRIVGEPWLLAKRVSVSPEVRRFI